MRSRASTLAPLAMAGMSAMVLLADVVDGQSPVSPTVPLGFEPNVLFNITIPDTARFIRYRTGAENIKEHNIDNSTWHTTFNPSQMTTDVLYGGASTGHNADAVAPGSRMAFVFVGTRCWINGDARGFMKGQLSNTSIGMPAMELELNYADNESEVVRTRIPTPSPGILADTGPLKFAAQSTRLVMNAATEGGLYTTTGITFSTGMKTEAASFDKAPVHVDYAVVDGAQNPRWVADRGRWTVESPFQPVDDGDGMQELAAYQHLNGRGESVQITIPIPLNTSYVVINGTGGPAQSEYYVTFDPPAVLTPVYANQTHGIATSPWVAPAVLAVTPLNPEIQYTLRMSGLKPAPNDLAIHSVTSYGGVLNNFPSWPAALSATSTGGSGGSESPTSSASAAAASTKSSKKSNAGAIAGGTIGGILALALLAGLLWYYCRRRKPQVDRADMAEFIIDDTIDPGHPYPAPMTQKSKWNHISTRQSPRVLKPGMSTPHLIASETSSEGYGYTPEQLGIPSPSTTDSQSLGYFHSPIAPVTPPKWTVGDAPLSPSTPLSPLAGRMESARPFNNMMGFSAMGPPPAAPRGPRQLRRAPRANQLIHQESDGGRVPVDDDTTTDSEDVDEVVVVPPSYDPAWRKSKRKPKRSSWRNEHALRLKV